MAQTDSVTRIIFDGRVPRVLRCGCKYDDTSGEHIDACDDHLARLRRRTVAILQRRRYAIAAGARSSHARLMAWRADADEQRAYLELVPWADEHDDTIDVIAYRSWEQMEAQLELDLLALARVNVEGDMSTFDYTR